MEDLGKAFRIFARRKFQTIYQRPKRYLFAVCFRFLSAFVEWLTERKRLTSDPIVRSETCRRGTSQHTANVIQSCTNALPGS